MKPLFVVVAIACQLTVMASTVREPGQTARTSVAAEGAVAWQYIAGG